MLDSKMTLSKQMVPSPVPSLVVVVPLLLGPLGLDLVFFLEDQILLLQYLLLLLHSFIFDQRRLFLHGLNGALFSLPQLLLLQPELFLDLLISNHYFLECLYSPSVSLLSEVYPHAEGSEGPLVIDGVLRILGVYSVTIGLLVLLIVHVFKCETCQLHLLAVDYYSVVSGLRAQAVLLATDYLELVVVQHADVSDCSGCPVLVLVVVLSHESGDDLVEPKLVMVVLVELILLLESLNVESHHMWEALSFLLGDLVDRHHLEEAMVEASVSGKYVSTIATHF